MDKLFYKNSKKFIKFVTPL